MNITLVVIIKVGDVKVGIIGLTADRGPQAVSPRVMDGFYLTPGKEELEAAVPLLRDKAKVDLLVLISERGLAANLELVETIPGVDVVLSSDMLEDIYHYIPIGPQIACGEISGDALHLQIEKSADKVLSPWVGWWGGGWLISYSGMTYDLDPYNEYWFRTSNIRVNGELLDPERMYLVAGYWNLDDPDKINRTTALQI